MTVRLGLIYAVLIKKNNPAINFSVRQRFGENEGFVALLKSFIIVVIL